MRESRSSGTDLTDTKVQIRILLAALWVCHFLLWTFGDALSLLQQMDDPIDDGSIVLFVAPSTAIVQALMVVVCLTARAQMARLANLVVAPVYVLFNAVFFVDASEGWEYYLGVFYMAFAALILWHAYRWPRHADA